MQNAEVKETFFGLIKKEKQGDKRKITLFGFIEISYNKKIIKRKNICLSGNCVTLCIPEFFNSNKDFRRKYEVVLSKPVFMAQPEDVDLIRQQVSECDIFITQLISGEHYKELGIDTESLKSVMKKDAEIIIMPVPYFTGYFPEQFYLHDKNGTAIGEYKEIPQKPSPYHNKIVFKGYIDNLSAEEVLDKMYSDNSMCSGVAQEAVKTSIAELKRREADTDFGISDFIEKNYRNHRLFYTINHPTNFLLNYMCEVMLDKLGIKKRLFQTRLIPKLKHEPLDFIITSILPSVKKELKLKDEVMTGNTKYTLDYIRDCYKYYDEHPDIVEHNKNMLEWKT